MSSKLKNKPKTLIYVIATRLVLYSIVIPSPNKIVLNDNQQ